MMWREYGFLALCFVVCTLLRAECHDYHISSIPSYTHQDQYPRFCPTVSVNSVCNIPHAPPIDLSKCSASQLRDYFAQHAYSQEEILGKHQLFMSDEFVKLAKTYPGYANAIIALHKRLSKKSVAGKCIGILSGSYCSGLAKRVARLYQEIQQKQGQGDCIANGMHNTTIACAQRYGITKEDLAYGAVGSCERQLSDEFVEQLSSVAKLMHVYNNTDSHMMFLDVVGEGIARGVETNKAHNVPLARGWADFCWQALEVARGIAEGVASGTYNTAHLICSTVSNPIRAAEDIIHGAGTILQALGKVVNVPVQIAGLCITGNHEQACKQAKEVYEQSMALAHACQERFAAMSNREFARSTTALATELVLTGKVLTFAHRACSRIRSLITKVAERLTEGAAVECGIAGAHGAWTSAEAVPQRTQRAACGVAAASRKQLEQFHHQFMTNLASEIARLKSAFDATRRGFGECANKYIKIAYEHILGMELSFNRKGILRLSGFHHDFMNALEKSGIFDFLNKIIDNSGCYKADIQIAGKVFKGKTFFPAHWSREKVVSKIYEVYDNFIAGRGVARLEKNGNYFVTGVTTDGIEIEMYITKNGKIKTAYPVIKGGF